MIFDKIATADLVLFDVSLVATGLGGKKHINSNVAIELGYALGTGEYSRVIKVMNTASGGPDELPFDLRSRRHPLKYHLAEGIGKLAYQAEMKSLASSLKQVLSEYLRQGVGRKPVPSREEHVAIPHTENHSAFWPKGRSLVPMNGRRQNLKCDSRSLMFLRLIPRFLQPEFDSMQCYEAADKFRPLVVSNGFSRARNEWGAIVFDHYRDSDRILSGFQVFSNREIWGFEDCLLDLSNDKPDGSRMKFIAPREVARETLSAIRQAVRSASEIFTEPKFKVVLGACGIKGHFVARPQRYSSPYAGPVYVDEVIETAEFSDDFDAGKFFNSFMRRLHRQAGIEADPSLLVPEGT